jgi:hypothetical protein
MDVEFSYDLWMESSWSLVSNGSNFKSFGVSYRELWRFYYIFLLRIWRVMSKAINRLVFCCKQVREKRKSVREIKDIVWIERN